MSNATRVVYTKTPITVDSVESMQFQKDNTLTAQLRQSVTTTSYYQGKRASNELNDSLFSDKEFGFSEEVFTSVENRIAWTNVPVGTTIEQVQAMLAKATEACIYRVLSSQPILSLDQQHSITAGQKTLDDYALTQIMRYPEGAAKAGELILDKRGNVQYRKTFFSVSAKGDIDLRSSDVYTPESLKEEISGTPTEKAPF